MPSETDGIGFEWTRVVGVSYCGHCGKVIPMGNPALRFFGPVPSGWREVLRPAYCTPLCLRARVGQLRPREDYQKLIVWMRDHRDGIETGFRELKALGHLPAGVAPSVPASAAAVPPGVRPPTLG